MERFIIGNCRNGKPITSQPDLDGFGTYEEIFDAMAALSVLAARWHRHNEHLDLAGHLEKSIESLESVLSSSGQMEVQKRAIGAKTAFDVMSYALGLLRPEFKE